LNLEAPVYSLGRPTTPSSGRGEARRAAKGGRYTSPV
jgi:hypothetical protein